MAKIWLNKIFKKNRKDDDQEWRTNKSILHFLTVHMDEYGKLTKESLILPDAKYSDENLKFAPGLVDAMFGVDESLHSKTKVSELVKHLKRISFKNDKKSDIEFYKLITEDISVIGIIDDFLHTISTDTLSIDPFLYDFATDLATKSKHRNAVKFGIAILGLCQSQMALDNIKTLGLHDEFTVYASIAIANLSLSVEDDLWELAQKVDGWGKIQLVERLAVLDLKDEIKDWLIHDGYKNDIMNEYLAFTCAMNGELHTKLQTNIIDKKLYTSARGIIEALIANRSPADDINNYPFAAITIQNFLHHALYNVEDVIDFNLLHLIKDYLTELLNDSEESNNNGWNITLISDCIIDTVEILKSKNWEAITMESLKSENNHLYLYAKQAADKLDIDLWEIVWKKLQNNPKESAYWYDVTQFKQDSRSEKIISFALNNLPLSEIATGPKSQTKIGEKYQQYLCIELITKYLENHPSKGEEIILAALNCPEHKTRNIALGVLRKWKKENWSKKIEQSILKLHEIEPNFYTKENISKLLKGENLE